MVEDDTLRITFSLNVKGSTTLLGAITGTITSQPGTARMILPLAKYLHMLTGALMSHSKKSRGVMDGKLKDSLNYSLLPWENTGCMRYDGLPQVT